MWLIKALYANLTIMIVWYLTEYIQFGELQWDRHCDDIVGIAYIILTTVLFYRVEHLQKGEQRETL